MRSPKRGEAISRSTTFANASAESSPRKESISAGVGGSPDPASPSGLPGRADGPRLAPLHQLVLRIQPQIPQLRARVAAPAVVGQDGPVLLLEDPPRTVIRRSQQP